jgi:diguanylate cyclase (GGDEF)-like protein/PAS domain S-box-containing protein
MSRRTASLLVVDDEELNRDLVSRRLVRKGCYTVDVAASGEQALQMVEAKTYDLVLLDQMMPGLNGMQVLARIREHHEPSQLPVIMVTALTDSKYITDALQHGANDYITKPMDFPVALARLEAQLSRKWAEEELRESQERYVLAARGSNDGIWDWDLGTGKIYYSPRWLTVLGYDVHEIEDRPEEWLERVHPDDSGRLSSDLLAHREGITDHFHSEHRLRHKDGTFRWVLARGMASRDSKGQAVRMAGSLTDITDSKVADALTGLPNRLLLTERLSRSIRNAQEHGTGYAVLFLDVDRFKVVNDSLGHVAGDQLLIGICQRLVKCLRSTDVVGRPGPDSTLSRLGGDEFGVLLESIRDRSDAEGVAERILEALRPSFHIDGRTVYTSVSIGIALSHGDYQKSEEVLRDSDTAMYKAKLLGGSRVAVFDSEMRNRAMARLKIEAALHGAIAANELQLQYQPIVSLDSSRTIGFEALLRWNHPEMGCVPPAEFVGIAEEVGLMSAIGPWVLEQACRDAAQWIGEEGFDAPFVSVNVSAKHLLSGSLVSEVDRVLASFALPPKRLRIEVTETALIADLQSAKDVVLQLKERGVLVSIDDFGTGYAGLQYLRILPVSTLKIDTSFVALMRDGSDNFPQAIVTLAHELGLDVVAEGIETSEDADRLKSMMCESGQGFYFAKPLGPEAVAAHICNPATRGLSQRANQGPHPNFEADRDFTSE